MKPGMILAAKRDVELEFRWESMIQNTPRITIVGGFNPSQK